MMKRMVRDLQNHEAVTNFDITGVHENQHDKELEWVMSCTLNDGTTFEVRHEHMTGGLMAVHDVVNNFHRTGVVDGEHITSITS